MLSFSTSNLSFVAAQTGLHSILYTDRQLGMGLPSIGNSAKLVVGVAFLMHLSVGNTISGDLDGLDNLNELDSKAHNTGM